MEYKRLELYVGWTCNHRCIYCCEFPNMEKNWYKRITKQDIFKKLVKYKKKGYNHVTFLGGEPFIQPIFLYALKLAKKLGYITLVTTNATTLHIESEAKKYLSYIGELILSVEGIDINLQKKISRTNAYVKWDKVFLNIKKYWNGNFLKVNIVIVKDNLSYLLDIVKYLIKKGIKNISLTYPDIILDYFSINEIREKIVPSYKDCMKEINKIYSVCKLYGINLKIVDIPFCVFPKNRLIKYIRLTDDYDYSNRIKIESNENILDRSVKMTGELPRDRFWVDKCKRCKYKGLCWGPSIHYKELFGLNEIEPIL